MRFSHFLRTTTILSAIVLPLSLAGVTGQTAAQEAPAIVAGDLNGRVAASEAAPAPRWRRVVIDGPDPVPEHPDTTDRVVSSGEMVRWLVRWRDAHPGVHLDAVSLDNEPDLWAETHPYAREAAEPDAFVTRSIQAAIAVKRADRVRLVKVPSEPRQ